MGNFASGQCVLPSRPTAQLLSGPLEPITRIVALLFFPIHSWTLSTEAGRARLGMMTSEFLAAFVRLSPGSQFAVVLVGGSTAYIVLRLAAQIVGLVLAILRAVLPKPEPTKKKSDDSEIIRWGIIELAQTVQQAITAAAFRHPPAACRMCR